MQSTIGALIWLWVTKGRVISFMEILGAGLAIGYLLSVFGSQVFRGTELQRIGPILPSMIGICFLLLFAKKLLVGNIGALARIRVTLNSLNITTFVLSALILITWWRWNPLRIDSWWKYQIDIPYIESYSNSIAFLGTERTFMSQGQSNGYHWFAYGWIGSFNQVFPTEPLYILTRVFPIVSLVMCLALSHAWASRLTESTFVRFVSPLATLVGPGFSIGSGVLIQSPGSAMSLGVGLLFSLLLFEVIDKRVSLRRGLPLLLLLSIGLTGGKISTAAVIAVGICTVMVFSMFGGGKQPKSLIFAYILVLSLMLLTYIFVVMSPFLRPIQIGIFKGWLGLFITSLSVCLGLIGLYGSKRYAVLFAYCASVFLTGAILSLILVDASGNQIYFLAGAVGMITTPSALGLEQILHKYQFALKIADLKMKIIHEKKYYLGITLFAFSGAALWKIMESTNSVLGDFGRTLAPAALLFMPIILFLSHIKSGKKDNFTLLKGKIHLAFYLAGLTSGVFGIILNSAFGPIYSNSSENIRYGISQDFSNGSVNQDYFDAGRWVRSSTPLNAFFFTNRLCLDTMGNERDCDGLWFMGSAVTRRQFLIEGSTYSEFLFDSRQGMTDLEILSLHFSSKPDLKLHQDIWNKGVRFGWIDKRTRYSQKLRDFSSKLYENGTIMIIQIDSPYNS